MIRFFNKFNKPYFWPIFGPLYPFWGQKKIWLCHAQHYIGPEHHAEFQKKTNETIPRKLPDGKTDRP